MPVIFNPDELKFQNDENILKEFALQTLMPRLSETAQSKHMVFDIRRLGPGKYSFPYHFHRNAEELILILSGEFTLRTPGGLQVVKEGELLFFEMGESSVHQFYNHADVACVYLDIRTTVGLDVVEYPDSGKIAVSPPGEVYKKQDASYNDGEERVEEIWETLRQE